MASKWSEVGALWKKEKGLSGILNLGVLGEITILVRENEAKQGKQPDFTIIAPKDNLLSNILKDNKRVEREYPNAPDTEKDVPF